MTVYYVSEREPVPLSSTCTCFTPYLHDCILCIRETLPLQAVQVHILPHTSMIVYYVLERACLSKQFWYMFYPIPLTVYYVSDRGCPSKQSRYMFYPLPPWLCITCQREAVPLSTIDGLAYPQITVFYGILTTTNITLPIWPTSKQHSFDAQM